MRTILSIYMIVGIFSILGAGISLLRLYRIRRENEQMQAYLDIMTVYFDKVQNYDTEIRQYRHDLSNHIHALSWLLEMDQSDRGEEEVSSLKESFDRLALQKSGPSQTSVLRAMLVLKQEECQNKHIAFSCDFDQDKAVLIEGADEIDLVAIVYNLIQNAIEANEKIRDPGQKREIRLQLAWEDAQLRIRIQNTVAAGTSHRLLTTKARPDQHGNGIMIIRRLVKKHHGTYTISWDEPQGWVNMEVVLHAKG